MEQQRARPFPALALLWLLTGLAMVAVPSWLAVTSFDPVLSGHPITLALGFASLVLGLLAVVLSVVALVDRIRRPAGAGGSKVAPSNGRRRLATIASIPTIIVCVAAVVLLGYSRPFGAEPVAIEAMAGTPTVTVKERLTSYDLVPNRQDSRGRAIKVTTGLVFYPGAKVDARAYAAVLQPLAESGYLVVVLKEPFGLALLEPGQAQQILDLHPEITSWAVGGHSLGGVAAASLADRDRDFTGLLLWASEPSRAMDRVNLKVLSVSGSNDGLETPARIAASKADLPPGSQFSTIKGAVHAYFGDYGAQPGDGVPTVSRSTAQAEIAQVSERFLAGLAARPRARSATPSASPTR